MRIHRDDENLRQRLRRAIGGFGEGGVGGRRGRGNGGIGGRIGWGSKYGGGFEGGQKKRGYRADWYVCHSAAQSRVFNLCVNAKELSNNKRPLEEDEKQAMPRMSSRLSDDPEQGQGNGQNGAAAESKSSLLIPELGWDLSVYCLARLRRCDYGSIASLNRSFLSLVRKGELYSLRRKLGIVEYWVYFSCNILEWEAFDPNSGRWMHLPKMVSNECFMCSDKESLAVGVELLVFGKEIMAPIIYKYSILTNSWSFGKEMNTPRCLFASASLGAIAILAGGCDPQGNILSAAELYDSLTGTWETLPNMNKARKMCSGIFMDGKFYVLGGIAEGNTKQLTCGEEFDLKTRTWREIPDMFSPRSGEARVNGILPATAEAPPLVAVVNNVLYAADYAQQEVRRYVKESNSWVTMGGLPEGVSSVYGWGLAFRACGDQLIVIGGPSTLGERMIEIHGWVPDEGAPQWNLLGRKKSGSFVYNCTVMGC
ncbi:F-box/kelch-repeat protein At1g26930-like [Abrus precatorius]|uniref:F-box/kelch-repeat protein At1g26930-like n=1 Tax=Abrus precatorius TaxID=3816 RepID=A0A8B8MMJ5_ABRPR|nr:F-box/kelch-repeat protein At1g26930-like [Abrus precatorius]